MNYLNISLGMVSTHGLTFKDLGGGGLNRFESRNEKRLENKCSQLMLISVLNRAGCTAMPHTDPLLL